MPAPAFVAAGSQFGSQAATTAPLPAGWAVGHFHLFACETGNEPMPAMTGWPAIGSGSINVATGTVTALTARYRIAQAGDAAADVPDSGDHQVGRIFGFSGADTASPFDGSPVFTTDNGTSSTVSFPTLTTTGPDRLIVHVVVSGMDTATSQVTGAGTNANLTGLANRGNGWISTLNGGGYAVITGVKAAAGSIGTTTVTHTTTGHPRALLTFALKPTTTVTQTATVPLAQTSSLSVTGTKTVSPAVALAQTSSLAVIGTAGPFVVTLRQSGTSGQTAQQNLATSSATPSANSLLLAGMTVESAGANVAAHSWSVSGGSLSYTQIGASAAANWGSLAQNALSAALYRAPIGGSPSAFAVTVDAYAGTETGYYSAACVDVVGADPTNPVVQSKPAGGTINPASNGPHNVSVTFDNPVTAGNLILVLFTAGADAGAGFTSPTAGAGKTFDSAVNQAQSFTQLAIFTRLADGAESQTITCVDAGNTVGNWGAVAVEIRKPPVTQQATVTMAQTSSLSVTPQVTRVAAVTMAQTSTLMVMGPFFGLADWLWKPIESVVTLAADSAAIVAELATGSHIANLYDYGVALRHQPQIAAATPRYTPTITNYPAWGDPSIRGHTIPIPDDLVIPYGTDQHYGAADPTTSKVYSSYQTRPTRTTSVTFVKQSTPVTLTGTGGTASFASATASGNLVVGFVAGDKNTGAWTAAGWNVRELTSTSVCNYLVWRVSTGETNFTVGWTSSSVSGNRVVLREYSDASSGTWGERGYAGSNTDESNVTSKATGTATATANGMAFASVCIDSNSATSGGAWTNGFTQVYGEPAAGGAAAYPFVATKPVVSGDAAVTSTFSHSGSADQLSGQVLVLGKTGSTAGVSSLSIGWGSAIDLHGDGREVPPGTSFAAGISCYATPIRQAELAAGVIRHALSFSTNMAALTVFEYPATKTDGSNMSGASNPIAEGKRVQLDPSINLAAIPGITTGELAIGVALQTYGAYCVDNGGARMAFPVELATDTSVNVAAGLTSDYFDLTKIPWSSLRVLQAWDSFSAGQTATVPLAQTSSLSVAGTKTVPAAVTMAGTSSLAVTPQIARVATVTLAQTSALAVTPLVTKPATIALAQTSSLAVTATVGTAIALAQTSALAVTGRQTVPAAVTLAQTSSIAVAALVSHPYAVALTQTSTLSVTPSVTALATVTLASSSTLAVAGLQAIGASVTMASTSALAVGLLVARHAAIALAQTSSLAVTGRQTIPGAVALAQTSSLQISAIGLQTATVVLTQTSALAITGTRIALAAIPMGQTSTLSVGLLVIRHAAVSFGQTSSLQVAGAQLVLAAVLLAQESTLTVEAVVLPPYGPVEPRVLTLTLRRDRYAATVREQGRYQAVLAE